MLKLGVYKPEGFFFSPPGSLLPYLYYRLSRSRVSLTLLDAAAKSNESALFERLMLAVRLANGVYRATFRQRFSNLNPLVNARLTQLLPSQDNLVIEDWAASTCLTSGEWAESLFPLFPNMRFVASDLVLFLIAVNDRQSGEIFIAEPDGHLLQYVRPPFVIRIAPPEPWTLPVNRLGYLHATRRWQNAQRIWPLPEEWLDCDRWEEQLQRDRYQLSKLPLIHPDALALAHNDSRFSIHRHSIFERSKSPAHVIRSMNILNKAYFSDEQLTLGVQSVIDSLHDGGIWIVGRTAVEEPPIHVHDVTLFQKLSSGRLQVIERHGAGSEIDSIALAVGS